MTPSTVLAEARRRGIRLKVKAGKLSYVAPVDSLDEEFRSEIRRHKAELLDLIAARPEETPEDASAEYWESLRWGLCDPAPAIVIITPDHQQIERVASLAFLDDEDAHAERFAIAMDHADPSQAMPPGMAFDGSILPTPPDLDPKARELGEAALAILRGKRIGITLAVDGKSLVFTDPKGALDQDDRDYLREQGDTLWALVVGRMTTREGGASS